ncbi:hypothetical protein KC852_01655 [Candidatus Nomurabacteria bacterium]|nr:hypothetical protein [Candidatus Nomurabacteria bacterium]
MTAQEYIEYKLNELKSTKKVENFLSKKELSDYICKSIMSKKFRKFSLIPEYIEHIKRVVDESIDNNLPIKFSFPFGGYKLWRLEETPEVDWAELFTLMYYSKWLKPIAEVYKPGIIFDFASDDMIVERMNNIPKEDTQKYKESFDNLVKFLERYIPENIKFTFTPISSFYTSEEFEKDLADKIERKKMEFGGLPVLDDKKRRMVELNVKLNTGQDKDPLWREKTELLHQSYYSVDKRRPYNRAKDKILVFPTSVKDGKVIAVGTTKTSVVKFWVGIGALKKSDNKYIEYILSPSQIEKEKITKESILIDGLNGKNFNSIGII